MIKNILNICLYQAIWFLCVLGGNKGAIGGLLLVAFHVAFSPCRKADLRMVLSLLAIGSLLDGSLQFLNVLQFATPGLPIPLWLAVIWMGLALLPHHSLAWLKGRPLLSMIFGMLGGPLAYVAGAALGAAAFGIDRLSAVILLGLIWGGLWPSVMLFGAQQSVFHKGAQSKP